MKKSLLLLALGLGALVSGGTVAEGAISPPLPVTSARVQDMLVRAVRYGPYVTLRRANEVARYYRLRGYNARVVYLPATNRYVVRVW